jgi:hypothetical protein
VRPVCEGLVGAHVAVGDQVALHHQGNGDAGGENGVEDHIGDLADGAVEELDHVVPGVEPGQLLVFHQQTEAKTRLLSEDHRLRRDAERLVDLGVGDVSLAQSAVRTVVVRGRSFELCVRFRKDVHVPPPLSPTHALTNSFETSHPFDLSISRTRHYPSSP